MKKKEDESRKVDVSHATRIPDPGSFGNKKSEIARSKKSIKAAR
jgi:hypothetical protein